MKKYDLIGLIDFGLLQTTIGNKKALGKWSGESEHLLREERLSELNIIYEIQFSILH